MAICSEPNEPVCCFLLEENIGAIVVTCCSNPMVHVHVKQGIYDNTFCSNIEHYSSRSYTADSALVHQFCQNELSAISSLKVVLVLVCGDMIVVCVYNAVKILLLSVTYSTCIFAYLWV